MGTPMTINGSVWVFTPGFRGMTEHQQEVAMQRARSNVTPAKLPNMLVLCHETRATRFEDGGRTICMHFEGPKVYVKVDDFGSAEALSENMGETVGVQYVTTFMLAEEY